MCQHKNEIEPKVKKAAVIKGVKVTQKGKKKSEPKNYKGSK